MILWLCPILDSREFCETFGVRIAGTTLNNHLPEMPTLEARVDADGRMSVLL